MTGHRIARLAMLLGACGVVSLSAGSMSGASTALPASGGVPGAGNHAYDGAPPEVRSAGARDWPLPGHDYDNTRDAGPSPIDAATVSGLVPAWTVAMAGPLTTVPLVLGSTVYAEDDVGQVVAVDRSSGRVLWRSGQTGFTVGPDGVAVGWGRVFAATNDGVEALDQATGTVEWTRRLTTTPTEGVDIQPTVVDGRVLAATVPVSTSGLYHGGDRGWLFSLNEATGVVRWSFDTVASPDLWGHPAVNSGGGAWYPPSVDAATDSVYWGTANPAPFPGTPAYPNGSSRPGPNLYTDATVDLDLRTGRLRWYHQATPHDLSDRDFVHTMIVDLPGPLHRSVVVGTGKGGQVLGMDPTTGRLLWKTEVGVHLHDDLGALGGPTEVLPGTYGGVLTPPASAGGTVYVATLNAPSTLEPDQPHYSGGQTGTMPGDVEAIDAATGRVQWETKIPGDPTGAATVVGNLVLTATLQGTAFAIDRSTGKIVWRRSLPGTVNGWLSVSGNLVIVPITGSDPPELLALHLPSPG